jgi:hypothetical protein
MRGKTGPTAPDATDRGSGLVEAIETGCCLKNPADPHQGEWVIASGSIWEADHPVVRRAPQWFLPLGRGAMARTAASRYPAESA